MTITLFCLDLLSIKNKLKKSAVRKKGIVGKQHLLNYYDISSNPANFIISLECTYILSVITAQALILFNIKQMGKDN